MAPSAATDGRTFLLAQQGRLPWPEMDRELGLDACGSFFFSAPSFLEKAKKPALFDRATLDSSFRSQVLSRGPEYTAYGMMSYGLHYCSSPAPGWWIEEHKADPDVFLHDSRSAANVQDISDQGNYRLNFWHPRCGD